MISTSWNLTITFLKSEVIGTMNCSGRIMYSNTRHAVGIYLIVDEGYLRLPTLICPWKHTQGWTSKIFFSSNIESVCKDVECVFGILKKWWKILEYRIWFRDIKVVEKVFNICCILHNNMLDQMKEREVSYCVGTGAPLGNDAIWLRGNTPPVRTQTKCGHVVGQAPSSIDGVNSIIGKSIKE